MASRKLVIEFIGKDTSAGKAASDLEKRYGKLGARMDKVGRASGKILAGGLVLAGGAAIKAGQAASDLAETQSKVNQIFGTEGAQALEGFAATAATSLGQSKQSALDASATFGVFGKAAGLAGDDLVGFSTEMTTLASDMASFNNTSPEEAIEAIGAALRGEAEPIRKFGVLLDDATLRNKALQMGLIKTTKDALTPQQKTLAAQAVILEQTSDQQGDFAKTSEGLANKQRILKAQMANLGAEIGAKVLPAMVKLTAAGLKAVTWIDNNQRVVGTLVVAFGSLLAITWGVSKAIAAWTAITKIAAAAQVVFTNVQWALNAALAANPIGLVVVAIAALVAGLVIAYKKSETFRKIVDGAFAAVAKAAKVAVDFIRKHWKTMLAILTGPIGIAVALIAKHWDRIKAGASAVLGFIKTRWKTILAVLTGPIGLAVLAITKNWDKIKDGFKAVRLALSITISGIKSAFVSGFNAMLAPIQAVIDKIQWLIDKIKSIPRPKLPDIPFVRSSRSSTASSPLSRGAVSPLSAARAAGPASIGGAGGGLTVIIQGALDPDAVARQVVQLVRKHERTTGRRLLVTPA